MRQSAGDNNIILNISSETTNEKNYDKKFIEWFIGFTEINGNFIVNKNGSLEFKITQLVENVQVLYKIKKILGIGTVSIQDKKNNVYHYRIIRKELLLEIINIFNGNIYLPKKQKEFELFVLSFNNNYKSNIELKENKLKPSFNNGWLSGFIETEGSFYICYKEKTKEQNNKISLRIIIDEQENIEIMEEINLLLKGNINNQNLYNGYNITVGVKRMFNILKYLKSYPLRTKKIIKYKSFYNIYNLIKEGVHLTNSGFIIVKRLIDKYKKL